MRNLVRIHGGRVVTPDGVIENGNIVVENGLIRDITTFRGNAPYQADDIDATGLWVLPGIVDIHSDAIEKEIGPRPNTYFPIDVSLHELERKLASQGITTIYHALALIHYGQGKLRKVDMVRELVDEIRGFSQHPRLIEHKIHLRFDICNIEALDLVEQLLRNGHIDELSFMDHTPGQGQFRDLAAHRKRLMLYDAKLSEHEAARLTEERQRASKVDPEVLLRLAELAHRQAIPVASHDDDSIEKLDVVEQWNVSISEFPIAMEVAAEAKRRGLFTVAGAPNVLRGQSHSGNLSALEAIQDDLIDILCSDYYPPSLLHTLFFLYAQGFEMSKAMNMMSLNPAKAVGIADKTGSIEPGKAADMLLVRDSLGIPVIEKVLVRGNIVCQIDHPPLREVGS